MSVFGRKGLMSQTLWAYEVGSDDGGIFAPFGIVFWSLRESQRNMRNVLCLQEAHNLVGK